MRIAYIIAAQRLIDQAARLVRALSAPGDTFFVHFDKKSDRKEGRNVLRDFMRYIGSSADVRPI